jgi:hypothetical protein
MSDNAGSSRFTVNPKRLGFQQAIDRFGNRCVISLAGADCVHGPERDGYLPTFFRLNDGRLFYARYTSKGFLSFRSHPGARFLEMTEEDAEIQCEKDGIPFPPVWKSTKLAGSSPQPHAPKRRRLKKGEAAVLICAALDSLAAKGEWNKSDSDIIRLAQVPRSTYYNSTKTDEMVQRSLRDYQARRLGRGPVRPKDI